MANVLPPFLRPPPPLSCFLLPLPPTECDVLYYTTTEQRGKEENSYSPHDSSPIFPPYASFPFSKIPKMGNGGVFPHSKPSSEPLSLSLRHCPRLFHSISWRQNRYILSGCLVLPRIEEGTLYIQMGFAWDSPSIHAQQVSPHILYFLFNRQLLFFSPLP